MKTTNTNHRPGFTLMELLISAIIMSVIMSLVTSLCFRASMVWKDISHHRVAMSELSNQLEQLTQLNSKDVQLQLEQLQPSSTAGQTLSEPRLSGELVESELGKQLNLKLTWKSRHSDQSVQLSGWIKDDESAEEAE